MEEYTFTRMMATEWLAIHLPKRTATQWGHWLRNNASRGPKARPGSYTIPHAVIGRTAYYRPSDLEAFARYENDREQGLVALTERATAEGAFNRVWNDIGRFYGQADKSGPFVKLAIDAPLQTFRLSLKEAAELMVQLDDAITNAESIAIELNPSYQRKLKLKS